MKSQARMSLRFKLVGNSRLCLHDEFDVILTLQGEGFSKMCDRILHGTPFRMTFLYSFSRPPRLGRLRT